MVHNKIESHRMVRSIHLDALSRRLPQDCRMFHIHEAAQDLCRFRGIICCFGYSLCTVGKPVAGWPLPFGWDISPRIQPSLALYFEGLQVLLVGSSQRGDNIRAPVIDLHKSCRAQSSHVKPTSQT